jgi:hypothetical protein
MICPANVNRSTMAAHSRGSVKVFVHEENGIVGGDRDGRAFFSLGEHLETLHLKTEVAAKRDPALVLLTELPEQHLLDRTVEVVVADLHHRDPAKALKTL